MALREIKRDAIPLVIKARVADRNDRLQFQYALMSIIRKAIAEPNGELAADLAAIGVRLPGSEPVLADVPPTVSSYLLAIAMAAMSGCLVGAAAVIVADFFRG
jgi:hypothetical protein